MSSRVPSSRAARRALTAFLTALAAALLVLPVPARATPRHHDPDPPRGVFAELPDVGPNPSGVGMYAYVPRRLAARPALLVINHYCTGTARAMFDGVGQEYVAAAEQHGFVLLFSQANRPSRCWDVASRTALTRGAGSDPVGIMSAVTWAVRHYHVDRRRISATGLSSGAMMTNLLLAQYPDVFSSGASFMGVAAGCFATDDPSLWSVACATGQLTRSPDEWAGLARDLAGPAARGRSVPRMQLWHGTLDDAVAFANLGEATKQWTALHGLSQVPTATDAPQPTWLRSCFGGPCGRAPVEAVRVEGLGHVLPQWGMVPISLHFMRLDEGVPRRHGDS